MSQAALPKDLDGVLSRRRVTSMAFRASGVVALAFDLYSASLGLSLLGESHRAGEMDKAGGEGFAGQIYQIDAPADSFSQGGLGLIVVGLAFSVLAVALLRQSRMAARISTVLIALLLVVQVGEHRQSVASMLLGALLIGGLGYLGWSQDASAGMETDEILDLRQRRAIESMPAEARAACEEALRHRPGNVLWHFRQRPTVSEIGPASWSVKGLLDVESGAMPRSLWYHCEVERATNGHVARLVVPDGAINCVRPS